MLHKKLTLAILASLSITAVYASHTYYVTNIGSETPIYVDFHGGGGTSHIGGSIASGQTKKVSTDWCHTSATAQVRHTNTTASVDIDGRDNQCSSKDFLVAFDNGTLNIIYAGSGEYKIGHFRNRFREYDVFHPKENPIKLSPEELEKARRCKNIPDGGVCPSAEDLKKKETENARFIAAGQQLFANAQKK